MAIIGLLMPDVTNIPCTWQNGLELICRHSKIVWPKWLSKTLCSEQF